MSNYENIYILNVKEYIEENTPLNFMLNNQKYDEIHKELLNYRKTINEDELLVVTSCYSLLYTALDYHLKIRDNPVYKSYYILIGDYISSYILEILYSNKLLKLVHLFILNNKRILINIINNNYEDDETLLNDIINYYKGR